MVGNFIKGLVAGGLGFLIWVVASLIEVFVEWGSESSIFFRLLMSLGFLLMILAPLVFWILLPTKNRWYSKNYLKYPIFGILGIFSLIVLLSALSSPSLPSYSFETNVNETTVSVLIGKIKEGGLSDQLKIILENSEGKEIDGETIFDAENLKSKRIDLKASVKEGNFTLIVKNIKNEIIYQKIIEFKLPKYSFDILGIDDRVNLTIRKREEGNIPDALVIRIIEKKDLLDSWWGYQKVESTEIKGEKTLTLTKNIGDFSKEYVVQIKNIKDEILFNKTVVLKPKAVKFGDYFVVDNIKITPYWASYTETYRLYDKAKTGYTFLVIEFKGKNIGDRRSSASSYDVKLKTSKGYLYEKYSWYGLSFDLLPEEEKTDYLIFEIPRDQSGVAVYFKIGGEERILQL